MKKKLNGWNNNLSSYDGVGGGKSFDESERMLLKAVRINVEKWNLVSYPETRQPLAIFKHLQEAEEYRQKYCVTAIIEPFEMIIK